MKSRNREMFKVGPIGLKRSYHKSWDEKGRNMISSIYVAFDEYKIQSIQFSYFQKGDHVLSEKYRSYYSPSYGRSCGQSYEIVRLNDDEYVTGLSGIFYESKITSLTFYTNQRKHGPFCKKHDCLKDLCTEEIDVGIRDRREFGGFFGSFSDAYGGLSSIGIYVNPTYDSNLTLNDAVGTRAGPEHGLRTKYTVTEVTDDDDDQLTLYQSSGPLSTINHNRKLKYQMPREGYDGYHVKPIVHNPKFEDKISLYQSSDRLARSTNNRTLEYQSPEFLDAFHVKPIGGKPKLKYGIFSKLARLFRNLLD
ncbi:putative jacalin-like lectin domain-containing protein [Arabidopsis thaliana]